METLAPIVIKCWADEVKEDEIEPVACQHCKEAICPPGITTTQVQELETVAAVLLRESSEAAKQEWEFEDGTSSPCCVLSSLPSAVNSRSSTAPSTPRGHTEACSSGPGNVPTLLQAPVAQPTTALERLQEAMRKHGFGCTPSDCAADTQVTTRTFATRDIRIPEKPVDKAPIRKAARLLQQAHNAQKGTFPRRRPERGASAHDSSARCSIPQQPAEYDDHRSTIKRRAMSDIPARPRPASMAGGLRMLHQSVQASAAERGCTTARRGQPARQQPEQEALTPKAAQPQDITPMPCAAQPAQLHEELATAPSGEPLPEDAEASLALAAEPTGQQEETFGPSLTGAAFSMYPQQQFGTLTWDSSNHCALEKQADLPEPHTEVQRQPATQHTAAGRLICFGSFTEKEAADLLLCKTAAQPHLMVTAESICAEAVAVSTTAVVTQPAEPVNKSTPEAILESTPMDQMPWPLTLPIQACSLAQTCSRWLLPQKLQLPVHMAVNTTIHVLAATSAAVKFYHNRQQ